jgi:hypothetical protein
MSYSDGEQVARRFRNEFLSSLNLLKTENNEMHHLRRRCRRRHRHRRRRLRCRRRRHHHHHHAFKD